MVYNGNVTKLRVKSQSYIVAYWSQGEAFADAVDYTMTMHELAADLIDNDLDVPRTTLIDRLKGMTRMTEAEPEKQERLRLNAQRQQLARMTEAEPRTKSDFG